jgi:hypothetical protein
VIAPAGNQLISECRYFQKSILAIPEPGQYEQGVNAHFVEEIGLGRSYEVDQLSSDAVNTFISRFNCSSERIPNGISDVIHVIRQHLPSVFSVESQAGSGEDVKTRPGIHRKDDPHLKMT